MKLPNPLYFIRQLFCFELLFILFLFAGIYKGDPRIEWIPVDLTALFFSLSLLSGFSILIRKKFIFKQKSFILVFLYLCFALLVLLSYLWTPSEIYSLKKTIYIWTLVFWSLAAPALIISTDLKRTRKLFILIFIFSLLIIFESINYHFGSSKKEWINIFGSNYLGLGRTIGFVFLIIIAYLIFWAKKISAKIIGITIASIYFWVLLISGGRGPLLATVFSAFIPFIFTIHINLKKYSFKIRSYMIPMFVFLTIIAVIFINLAESRKTYFTFDRLLILTQKREITHTEKFRLNFYKKSLEIWPQAPFLGFGIGSWPVLYSDTDKRQYPHNIIFEILVELGLIGLFLFIALIIYSFSFLIPFNSIGYYPTKILLIMLFFNTLLNSMVSGDIPDNRLLFFSIGLMPSALYANGNNKMEENITKNANNQDNEIPGE